MKKFTLFTILSLFTFGLSAQLRYVDEVFTDAQINVASDITYSTNINFLISTFTNPAQVQNDLTAIKTAWATGQPINPSFYNPADASTVVKVSDLKMDIYHPNNGDDSVTNRPVVVLLHTGNFLPPVINGSVNGDNKDSSLVENARRLARKGYVAVLPNYRLGWNPVDPNEEPRTAGLLNAVYRAIQDVKSSVRFLNKMNDQGNPYGTGDQYVLWGHGTGGYVALAYATMDDYDEIELQKFTWSAQGPQGQPIGTSYIDTSRVGDFDGFSGLLNLDNNKGYSSDIDMTVNLGGALADTFWLNDGDVPMVSFHCVRDPFAPYDEGIVIVPTGNLNVVEVQGAGIFMPKANALGNNDAFKNFTGTEHLTNEGRKYAGQSFSSFIPGQNITVPDNAEGLYSFVLPLGQSRFQNQASPWDFWDPNSARAQATVAGSNPPVTVHQAGLASNPDMSKQKAMTYLDTVHAYAVPRIARALNLPGTENVNVEDLYFQKVDVSISPNPTAGMLNFKTSNPSFMIKDIRIFDISGRMVNAQFNVNQDFVHMNLAGNADGMYISEITLENGDVITKKIALY